MYRELGTFLRRILMDRSLWKDGELWTAVAIGLAAYFWFSADPGIVVKVRQHFGELLSAASIVFGFALAALLFYIQAAGVWANNKNVSQVADKIVDWHVWTIVCLLFLIGYILLLWAIGSYVGSESVLAFALHAFLVFLLLYCAFQILNHTLTIWWAFVRRKDLNK